MIGCNTNLSVASPPGLQLGRLALQVRLEVVDQSGGGGGGGGGGGSNISGGGDVVVGTAAAAVVVVVVVIAGADRLGDNVRGRNNAPVREPCMYPAIM